MFVVFNSCKVYTMSLPDGIVTHWMAVVLYFFCVQFLSVRSSQNKQAYWLYCAFALCWLQHITHLAMFGQQLFGHHCQVHILPTEWPAIDCPHWWYFYCSSVRLLSLTQELWSKFYNIWFSSLGYWGFLAGHLLLNISEKSRQRRTCI